MGIVKKKKFVSVIWLVMTVNEKSYDSVLMSLRKSKSENKVKVFSWIFIV